MKIHNDQKALEQMIAVFNAEIEKLQTLRNQLSTQIDKLYHSGFQDRKFLELKSAMDGSGQLISAFSNEMNSLIEELSRRKSLVVEYYSIAL
jgi:hypothetical protein